MIFVSFWMVKATLATGIRDFQPLSSVPPIILNSTNLFMNWSSETVSFLIAIQSCIGCIYHISIYILKPSLATNLFNQVFMIRSSRKMPHASWATMTSTCGTIGRRPKPCRCDSPIRRSKQSWQNPCGNDVAMGRSQGGTGPLMF